MRRIIIFDTTLRDGEQAAGIALTSDEKLEIAKQLDLLGVDVIEAGFPASSRGDFEAVRRIAREVRRPVICALAHADRGAIDRAWEALREAENPRIHVFLSSSEIHLSFQLRKTQEEILQMVHDMVSYAKGYVDDVEFSPMDATRTEPSFLYKVVETAIDAGATTINIPDTVGYAIPAEFGQLIRSIFENVPNIHKAVLSVHCHNDLGLAVANSLAALEAGARQVECTVNGIGERAGNAALEEIVMALKVRQDFFGFETGIDTTQIYKTSRLVSELTGIYVQPNKAIVGANAFRHGSGIHQDGVLKKPLTYEIMEPESVGIKEPQRIVLGKLSGRHAFRKYLEELGYDLSPEELNRVFAAFKELADRKKEITTQDIDALVSQELRGAPEIFVLEQIQVSCGEPGIPTASVRIRGPEGEVRSEAALGVGPVDATFKAINKAVNVPVRLIEYSVKSITGGIDAMGEVTVRIEGEGKVYAGRGLSTDIIVASAKAYLAALNRFLASKER